MRLRRDRGVVSGPTYALLLVISLAVASMVGWFVYQTALAQTNQPQATVSSITFIKYGDWCYVHGTIQHNSGPPITRLYVQVPGRTNWVGLSLAPSPLNPGQSAEFNGRIYCRGWPTFRQYRLVVRADTSGGGSVKVWDGYVVLYPQS